MVIKTLKYLAGALLLAEAFIKDSLLTISLSKNLLECNKYQSKILRVDSTGTTHLHQEMIIMLIA